MKSPNALTDSELSKYADEHVAYELDMLCWSGSIIYAFNVASLQNSPIQGPLSQPIANSLLESFAIHTRNLIDFLYLRNFYRRDRATDIIVEDYLDDPANVDIALPAITELLKNAKVKADKQVAHLASQRLHYGVLDKSWFFTEIVRDIMTVFQTIVPYVPPSKAGKILPKLASTERPYFVAVSGEHTQSQDGMISGISFSLGQH